MGTHDVLEGQLSRLIEDARRLLTDMAYYDEKMSFPLPTSDYYKLTTNRKIQQLIGLRLLVAETEETQSIEVSREMLSTIKTELYILSKRWQLDLGTHLSKYPAAVEKPHFSFS